MLSARGEESDVVTGLELGADDYVTKPFSAKILIARLKSVLRRRQEPAQDAADEDCIDKGALTIDLKRHRTFCDGEEMNLSTTEYEILKFLASHPGWVFTRSHIVKAVKGDDYPVTDRAVDVQVVNIRKKLGDHAGMIETVRGVGYRFQVQ
jgi:two-component system phosphate regulon response regulator PhoB